MSTADIFGPIVSAAQVETAVLDTLKAWARTYVRAIERKRGRGPGSMPLPRSWPVRSDAVKFAEDQLPAVVIESPGTASPPVMMGDGLYTADWNVNVIVFVAANTGENARALAQDYAAAFEALLVHKRSLGGVASEVEWTGARYDDIPAEQLGNAAVARCECVVTLDGVLDAYGGPDDPDDHPGDRPEATEVIVNRDDGTRLVDVVAPEAP